MAALLPAAIALIAAQLPNSSWSASKIGLIGFFLVFSIYIILDAFRVYKRAILWSEVFDGLSSTNLDSTALVSALERNDDKTALGDRWDKARSFDSEPALSSPIEKVIVSFSIGIMAFIAAVCEGFNL